jgi:two-component system alkaline phosphatase synthesis response regulator PhoP
MREKLIMVCDDDLYVIEAVSFLARREGYEVISAENGKEGLCLAQKQLPSLLFLDVMLGEETGGLEICKALKSDPDTCQIYIILLTAMGQSSDTEKGYLAGADEYCLKPFQPRMLCKRMHELLDAQS